MVLVCPFSYELTWVMALTTLKHENTENYEFLLTAFINPTLPILGTFSYKISFWWVSTYSHLVLAIKLYLSFAKGNQLTQFSSLDTKHSEFDNIWLKNWKLHSVEIQLWGTTTFCRIFFINNEIENHPDDWFFQQTWRILFLSSAQRHSLPLVKFQTTIIAIFWDIFIQMRKIVSTQNIIIQYQSFTQQLLSIQQRVGTIKFQEVIKVTAFG